MEPGGRRALLQIAPSAQPPVPPVPAGPPPSGSGSLPPTYAPARFPPSSRSPSSLQVPSFPPPGSSRPPPPAAPSARPRLPASAHPSPLAPGPRLPSPRLPRLAGLPRGCYGGARGRLAGAALGPGDSGGSVRGRRLAPSGPGTKRALPRSGASVGRLRPGPQLKAAANRRPQPLCAGPLGSGWQLRATELPSRPPKVAPASPHPHPHPGGATGAGDGQTVPFNGTVPFCWGLEPSPGPFTEENGVCVPSSVPCPTADGSPVRTPQRPSKRLSVCGRARAVGLVGPGSSEVGLGETPRAHRKRSARGRASPREPSALDLGGSVSGRRAYH